MHIHKRLKTLYLLLLAIGPSYSYSMDLALEAQKDLSFPIQTYPADLQCMVFESMLFHLNNYQTNFFEDNQIQDKEEIKKIGVLRYQVACFMIKHLLSNSISPEKTPHSIDSVRDILYHSFFSAPPKNTKMSEIEFFKHALQYKPVSNIINSNIKIPKIISDILQKNIKAFVKKEEQKNSIEAQFAYE